jgi:hypothetical protein
MSPVLIAVVITLATFTQSASGFGVSLIAMPLLTAEVGLAVAAPLVALIAMICRLFILVRYRHAMTFSTVWPLILGAVLGIPLGFWAVDRLDETLVKTALGVVVIGYALYDLLGANPPVLDGNRWGYGLGFISGILAAAYNTPGPPAIIFATSRRWPPAEFKSNLQAFALISGILVLVGHALKHNYTAEVGQALVISLPAIAIGLATGFYVSERIDPVRFRQFVLLLLILVGLRLIV